MDEHGLRQCTALSRRADGYAAFLDFPLLCRARHGSVSQAGRSVAVEAVSKYALDVVTLKFGRVDDGAMEFSNPVEAMREIERLAS